jgi:cell division protein FtsW (lipid II flippase)
MLKQVILIIAGIVLFLLFGAWLRDLRRVKATRLLAAITAAALLAVNLVFGLTQFGAKNWLEIGGFSFQPSEFVKILFILAGAATMDRLYHKQNLVVFIGFAAACVGALAVMGDFGTALVFFCVFLVISFLRSGSFATLALALTGTGLAGFLAVSARPYIADRFALWGRAWQDVNGAGFQQTRAMSAAATGGLFGNGAGNGWLEQVVASETDLVFALVSEELGLLVALSAAGVLIILTLFVVKNAVAARSSFYVIAGVGAVSLMLVQMSLNVFGSLDILPFTGVTFPFVSMGGSSLISCWMLLAFIKSTDTRKNSSFAVKSPAVLRDRNEFTSPEENEAEDEAEDEPFVEDARALAIRNGRNIFDRRGERKPLKRKDSQQ